MASTPIDRDKLRAAIRKMGNQYVFFMLDDVIVFADEGGSWQVGVNWEELLPPWMKVLSATAGPDHDGVARAPGSWRVQRPADVR